MHAEIDCLNNAGRIKSYENTVIYSTLAPCYMCGGAIIQFRVPKLVIGESQTFPGSVDLLKRMGVEVIDLAIPECVEMMKKFIAERSELWYEDVGQL